jgi:hypothetical protein
LIEFGKNWQIIIISIAEMVIFFNYEIIPGLGRMPPKLTATEHGVGVGGNFSSCPNPARKIFSKQKIRLV